MPYKAQTHRRKKASVTQITENSSINQPRSSQQPQTALFNKLIESSLTTALKSEIARKTNNDRSRSPRTYDPSTEEATRTSTPSKSNQYEITNETEDVYSSICDGEEEQLDIDLMEDSNLMENTNVENRKYKFKNRT